VTPGKIIRMKFVELVVEKLGGLFQQHGLQVSEQFTNYIKFESGTVAIAIGRDFRDNSTSASTGPPVGPFSTLNNDVLQHIFNSNINIENCTPDVLFTTKKYYLNRFGYPSFVEYIAFLKIKKNI
jgi:hypothetical protein